MEEREDKMNTATIKSDRVAIQGTYNKGFDMFAF